jgi:glutamyl-tRNA reductase
MILGAGKMSELTAKHLSSAGAKELLVVNRTVARAEELARKMGGVALSMEQALRRLHETDIVISSTGAERFVLSRSIVEEAMAGRKQRPLFLIDIAVPRDIDPACGELRNVFLYDIDDLEGIVETNLENRRKEAAVIETMIAAELAAYQEWYATLGVAPLIRGLQEKAAAIHEQTLDSLLRKVPDLDDRQIKVIRKLTKSMLSQMIHDPILRVKEMSAARHGEAVMDAFVQLFALEEDVPRIQAQMQAGENARANVREAKSADKAFEAPSILSQLAGALR